MQPSHPSSRPKWLVPMATLGAAALLAFSALYAIDTYFSGGSRPVARYFDFDPQSLSDAISSFSGIMAAVFGIVITVVSIIVQLSADRYTGVARMFLRDRINLTVIGYYMVSCVCSVWFGVTLKHDAVPKVALTAILAVTSGGFVLMAPYFGYVFWFLEPQNIITRIRRQAVETVARGSQASRLDVCAQAQVAALYAMEELTDITSNSISGKDKIIASGAVDALRDFALEYLKKKPTAADVWFKIGAGIRENPDFVAMAPESLDDLECRRTWVEWKVMRQYLGIYNEALATMRDINYLIAIDTRYIGEAAARGADAELMQLVFRFMNSYLRSTINARDVRTAYNVLNQYRLLVEAMLREGRTDAALEGVKHMSYYGHVSYDMKLTFVTETVAYDISALCQHANELGSPVEKDMLRNFLELDRPLRSSSQESALLGVRKAQVKLAAYYLMRGDEPKARAIADDMAHEPKERLTTIRRSLESVTSKDFWEIIDRGRNFEYMPPPQRACLVRFFAWHGIGDGEPAAPDVKSQSIPP